MIATKTVNWELLAPKIPRNGRKKAVKQFGVKIPINSDNFPIHVFPGTNIKHNVGWLVGVPEHVMPILVIRECHQMWIMRITDNGEHIIIGRRRLMLIQQCRWFRCPASHLQYDLGLCICCSCYFWCGHADWLGVEPSSCQTKMSSYRLYRRLYVSSICTERKKRIIIEPGGDGGP